MLFMTFHSRDKELILQIPLSYRREADMWYWLHDPCGVYSVRSCYKLLTHRDNDSSTSIWRSLWKLELPNKVRNFLWQAATNVLPSAVNLVNRRVVILPICSLCNAYDETVTHALLECEFARLVGYPLLLVFLASAVLFWLGWNLFSLNRARRIVSLQP